MPRALLLVLVVALAVRVVFVAEWYGLDGDWALPVIDALEYEEEALRVVRGEPTPRIYWHAPLYPYFIAAVYQVGSWLPRHVAIAQALLGLLSVAGVYGIAARLGAGRWAWAPAAITALYGPLIYFEGQLLRPALFTFLLVAWLGIHLAARRSSGGRSGRALWLVSGLVLGVAALCRETALLLIPAVVVGEGLLARRGVGPAALLAVGALVALA
ncbi:MAG: glycosyltransferase family 39 protein, partial [Planctomycetota bacterium]